MADGADIIRLDLCVKIVDAVHLMDNLHSLAAQYYFDWVSHGSTPEADVQISITISYLLSSAIAYVCQWFFARRAWALWSNTKWIRPPVMMLAHCSLISQIIWVAWNARQPKLRSSLERAGSAACRVVGEAVCTGEAGVAIDVGCDGTR